MNCFKKITDVFPSNCKTATRKRGGWNERGKQRPAKAAAAVSYGVRVFLRSGSRSVTEYGYSCLLLLLLFGVGVTPLLPELKCQQLEIFNSLLEDKVWWWVDFSL